MENRLNQITRHPKIHIPTGEQTEEGIGGGFWWGAYPAGGSTCTSSAGTRSACRLCRGRAETRRRRLQAETCGTCEGATPSVIGPRCRCCDLGAGWEPRVSERSSVPPPTTQKKRITQRLPLLASLATISRDS